MPFLRMVHTTRSPSARALLLSEWSPSHSCLRHCRVIALHPVVEVDMDHEEVHPYRGGRGGRMGRLMGGSYGGVGWG